MWRTQTDVEHIDHIDHLKKLATLIKNMPDTPLRPHILAAFLPWGGFAGAGRPARRKGRHERREIGMKRDLFFHPRLKTNISHP